MGGPQCYGFGFLSQTVKVVVNARNVLARMVQELLDGKARNMEATAAGGESCARKSCGVAGVSPTKWLSNNSFMAVGRAVLFLALVIASGRGRSNGE